MGICQTESTESSSAIGDIEVYIAIPMLTVIAARATDGTAIDTQAEIDALLNDKIAGDVSSLVYTIDENQANDATTNGYCIVGGNPILKELYFTIVPRASLFGSTL